MDKDYITLYIVYSLLIMLLVICFRMSFIPFYIGIVLIYVILSIKLILKSQKDELKEKGD
jgi:O-antigen ligase